MGDRLIELLCGVECAGSDRREGGCGYRDSAKCNRIEKLDYCMIACIADHLLANGVIVPPCKVGDTVYKIEGDGIIRELKAISCSCLVSDSVRSMTIHCSNYREAVISFTWSDFGKTVFLTREDAEQALKGGEE